MNWQQFELKLLARNPGLANPQNVLRISAQSFLAQMERAFAAGADNEDHDTSTIDSLFPFLRKNR